MSIIAAKKAMQKKGKETILIIAGATCAITSLIIILFAYILKTELSRTLMTPIMYFFIIGGINIAIGSYLRENREDKSLMNEKVRNYLLALIALGILGAAIIGAYNW
jgi:hypothetical protein